jgi:hypothetical protein
VVNARPSPMLAAQVRARGVVAERELIDAVAGEQVRGSWWGHPAGQAIFHALEAVRDDPDVFLCKLLEGKQTYVHRRLWPALLRIQSEVDQWPALSAAARRLLTRVEAEGAVQATGRLRLELERSLRVVARSEHTASGAHRVLLTPFRVAFPAAVERAARRLSLDQARALLVAAGAVLPTSAPPVRTSGRRAPGTGHRAARRGDTD